MVVGTLLLVLAPSLALGPSPLLVPRRAWCGLGGMRGVIVVVDAHIYAMTSSINLLPQCYQEGYLLLVAKASVVMVLGAHLLAITSYVTIFPWWI